MSNEYPRALYHEDGRTDEARDADHEERFGDGWSRSPSDVHRRPLHAGDAVVPVHPSNHDDLVERISDRVVEKLTAAGAFAPGGGRPPKSLAERGASRVGDPKPKSED